MRKVKKIKKIPKYFDGTQSIAAIKDPIKTKANESGNAALSAPLKQPDALTKHNAQQMSDALSKNYGISPMQNVPEFMGLSINNTMLGAAASAAEPVAQAFGIEQGKAGKTISTIGKAVGMVNPAIGAALQIAGATAGGRATLDRSMISATSNVNDAVSHNTGWIGGLMGADRDALLAQASGIQNSKMAAEQTANKQLEWANDPRNLNMVFAAKEGGLVPGEHFASRGEVETDSDGNNAVRYAWDPKGKDTYHVYTNPDGTSAEGNMIFNEEGVKRPNGMKYSDTAEMIITHTKDPKLKKINLKKLAAEQDVEKEKEGKTKNGIPAYEGGNNGKSSRWSDRARNYMESVIEPAIVDYVHRATYDPYGFSGSTFIPADRRIIGDEIEKELLKFNDPNVPITLGTMTGTTISPDKSFIKQTTSPTTIGYDQSFNRYSPIGQALGQFGSDFKLFGERALKPRRNLFSFAVQNNTINETNASKTGDSDSSSKKITTGNKNKSKTATPVINRDGMWIGNPKKQTFDVPSAEIPTKLNNIPKMVRAKDAYAAIGKENTSSNAPLNWEDLAYQAASILTPLLDRENAETTVLQRPTWKGIPVSVDVQNQLQDSQLGYALANYNIAQGGYTAGQQLAARSAAASNLAKQRAAIHQLQTEQQNKNIAQNIASYNNYANVIADIANKEIDINAANRAAARNINRQNKATALKNWGQINNDQNKRKMDKLRIAAAAPMFEYGMENYNEMVKMLTEMGLWQ